MNHSPRRPYYNRGQNMPQNTGHDDSVSINNKRIWKLWKDLRRRQDDAKDDDESRKPAQSGK